MKITLAQLNATVGDLRGNLNKLKRATRDASQAASDLIVFPECFLVGYPPRDLIDYQSALDEIESSIAEVCAFSATVPETAILFGTPRRSSRPAGKGLYNAAVLVQNGSMLAQINKALLPSYDVFDETRYFDPAENEADPVSYKGESLGITICEDAWNVPSVSQLTLYDRDPVRRCAERGATILINISAAPFAIGREAMRAGLARIHAQRHGLPFVLVNQVGGNDDLIFDGTSVVCDAAGNTTVQLASFAEDLHTFDPSAPVAPRSFQALPVTEAVYRALVLGIRDYVGKCGQSEVIIGLSGGVDSAVTCALAVAALGRGRVSGVSMPSAYSSPGSISDAEALARNLDIPLRSIAIQELFERYNTELSGHFSGLPPDVTEENIQARIRGTILMALANKFGGLVLATGNKSELAMGYCTLYGDMSGGLAVLADVSKTMVYELAAWINRAEEIIPQAIIDKAPSAELRPEQKDADSLPPYDILDEILLRYIEQRQSPREIAAAGFDAEVVQEVIHAVDRSEYKRRQAPPGLKITTKAFGFGRRMPIAAAFRHDPGDLKK